MAPTEPGIPDKFSNPYKFLFNDSDTMSSQISPAPTIKEFPLTENPFKLFLITSPFKLFFKMTLVPSPKIQYLIFFSSRKS